MTLCPGPCVPVPTRGWPCSQVQGLWRAVVSRGRGPGRLLAEGSAVSRAGPRGHRPGTCCTSGVSGLSTRAPHACPCRVLRACSERRTTRARPWASLGGGEGKEAQDEKPPAREGAARILC